MKKKLIIGLVVALIVVGLVLLYNYIIEGQRKAKNQADADQMMQDYELALDEDFTGTGEGTSNNKNLILPRLSDFPVTRNNNSPAVILYRSALKKYVDDNAALFSGLPLKKIRKSITESIDGIDVWWSADKYDTILNTASMRLFADTFDISGGNQYTLTPEVWQAVLNDDTSIIQDRNLKS